MNDFLAVGYDLEDIKNFLGEFISIPEKTKYNNLIEYFIKDKNKKSELFIYTKIKKTLLGAVKEEFLCCHPSFYGKTKQSVKEVNFLFSNTCPLCVSLNLWVKRDEEEYPLIVDIPNYLQIKDLDLSKITNISITLFPGEINYWPDIESFDNHIVGKDNLINKLWSKGFIPSGTFTDKNSNPSAYCLCNGIVNFAEEVKNEHTGRNFYHVIISTYAADYDVVIQKDAIKELPKINSVIGGHFWVCGKLV